MKQLLLLAAAGLLLSQESYPQSAQQLTQNSKLAPVATQPASQGTGRAAVVVVPEGNTMPETRVKAVLRYLQSSYQLLIAHPAIIAVFVVAPNQKDIIPVAPVFKRHTNPA